MKAEILQVANTIINIFGFIAVIWSIRLSAKGIEKSFKVNSNSKVYDELHHIHRAFIEHPHLRPIFYNNRSVDIITDENEKYRAFAIAELFFDVFEYIYQLSDELNEAQKKMWKDYVESMCNSSEFLTLYLKDNTDLLYPEEFKKDITRYAKRFEKKEITT